MFVGRAGLRWFVLIDGASVNVLLLFAYNLIVDDANVSLYL